MLTKDSRIAVICRGGPENGPFSASAFRALAQVLKAHGCSINAIFANSGAVPTALLGCIGQEDKLCDIWDQMKPEDIVGKLRRRSVMFRLLLRESALTNEHLEALIVKNLDLEKVFSPQAIPITIMTVLGKSGQALYFTNQNPAHRLWFVPGVLGSMGLIPFLPPAALMDYYNKRLGRKVLVEELGIDPSDNILFDGAYKDNIQLEKAIRDSGKFDTIFIIDLHGLEISPVRQELKPHWAHYLRRAVHILINSNDATQFRLVERINEELEILEDLQTACELLPANQQRRFREIISRMKSPTGRLKLGDKRKVDIRLIADPEHSVLFDFSKFKHEEVLDLMKYGRQAALMAARAAGLSTDASQPA